MRKDAVIDDTQQYRYWLLREWDAELPTMVFVMLNPSTADADVDDRTIRRCISFAKSLDFGSIQVVNLFAYRSTDPKQLRDKNIEPIGLLNDKYIIDTCQNADIIIAAWGTNGVLNARDSQVIKLITRKTFDIHCLEITTTGHPKHPLYIKGDAKPVLYKKKAFERIVNLIPTVEKRLESREGLNLNTMSDYDFHRDVMEE